MKEENLRKTLTESWAFITFIFERVKRSFILQKNLFQFF